MHVTLECTMNANLGIEDLNIIHVYHNHEVMNV